MKHLLYFLITLLVCTSCEDQINPNLEEANPVVVIDAWLDNQLKTQSIWIGYSQPYFDNQPLEGIDFAQVRVTDSQNCSYYFSHTTAGSYTYQPADESETLHIGEKYQLEVIIDGQTFTGAAKCNMFTEMDRVTFDFEEDDGFYYGVFWAKDRLGAGDFYWIKSYKNQVFQSKPSEINIAADAGFSRGGIDGITFIEPIRYAVSPINEDANGNLISPFRDGDHLRVELHAISGEAFDYLNQIRTVTDRPGGFAELFATPLSNVDGNIQSTTGDRVLGFFNVSGVSAGEAILVEAEVN